MSNKGHNRERDVKKLLEKGGWWVGRCAGSLGDADLVALKGWHANGGRDPALRQGDVWLIEVKATAGGAYEHFGPRDRAELAAAAKLAGAEAWLCWWPPNKPRKWIPESQWPRGKGKG